MSTNPIIVERTYNVPAAILWKALTDRNEMRRWYFDLDAFEPTPGFKFQFYGGTPENQYLHICEVREVIWGQKLSYTWRYDGYPGDSLVTFELFPDDDDDSTLLRLTHSGLETLEKGHADFARANFEEGWTYIINISLPEYLPLTDEHHYHHSISTKATSEQILTALTNGIKDWWTRDFSGSAEKQGDEFTVRFGSTVKTFKVYQLTPGIRITWECTAANIDADFLKNKSEWVGTKIHWETVPTGNHTILSITHEGLTPEKECYEICEKGWNDYIDGPLKTYLEKSSSK